MTQPSQFVQRSFDKSDALPHYLRMRVAPLLPLFALSGCVVGTIAETAADVATLPVKAASAGVDAVTTSQSEADEKRGRELREAEERAGREYRLAAERCRKGKPQPGDDCTRLPAPR